MKYKEVLCMSCTRLTKNTVPEIADDVISGILSTECRDPFSNVKVVCHNSRVLQWFKSYFLKKRSEVLMNVEFETLSVFLNGIINPRAEYTILDKNRLRDYIIREMMTPGKYAADPEKNRETDYIFNADGSVNGANLFEFADKLAALFLDYEFDEEDFASFGWEYDVYVSVIGQAEKDGCFTTKSLFDRALSSGLYEKPQGRVFVINNSYMTPLFGTILKKTCAENVVLYELDGSADAAGAEEPAFFSAPTPLREIEELHSRICKIVQKNDPELRFSDFLVYAPDINVYANSIARVFRQDGNEFPRIPYRISGEITEKKQIGDALKVLYDIACKRFFTRNDFYKLVINPMMQIVGGFTGEDAEVWMDVIVATNTHRNEKHSAFIKDDWDYLKKRLLTSVLVSDSFDIKSKVELAGGQDCIPYGCMDLDLGSMSKMLDLIEKLENWNGLFAADIETADLDKDGIRNLRQVLDSLFSFRSKNGAEKNYLYREIEKALDRAEKLFDKIPTVTLMQIIIDAPSVFSSNPTDLFTSGVTFMNLRSDDVVSAKYVYLLGLSSAAFPRITRKNELDRSEKHRPNEELDEASMNNIVRGSDHVTFSYVNCDVKTEEPFYPSPLIRKYSDAEEHAVPLDEKRDYSSLFTRKEFKDRKYYDGLFEGQKTVAEPDEEKDINNTSETVNKAPAGNNTEEREPVRQLKTSDLKSFLENTFLYHYKALTGMSDDDDEKEYRSEYELIDDNGLARYVAIKQMIDARDNYPDGIHESLKLNQAQPDFDEAGGYLGAYEYSADVVRHVVLEGFEPFTPKPFDLVTEDGRKWTLVYNDSIHTRVDGKCRTYVPSRDVTLKNPDNSYLLSAYIISLMDIASTGNNETEVTLGEDNLCIKKEFKITPEAAYRTLNDFYELMTDYSNLAYMDLDFIFYILNKFDNYIKKNKLTRIMTDDEKKAIVREEVGQDLSAFAEYMTNDYLSDHYKWKKSTLKKTVNPIKDLGYTDDDFPGQFYERLQKIRELIKYPL